MVPNPTKRNSRRDNFLKNSGKILVLAWPDTFVKHSDEWLCKVLPWVGLGTRTAIKAGHAALVLIENKTGACAYYDFGRYITPKGMGRVRGVTTDAELEIPMKAHICKDGIIENLSDILRWLAAHPDKTHGEGRLVASVCDTVDHDAAHAFIVEMQRQGSIPYGAFHKNGSNCARFVADTILASTDDVAIQKALRFNKSFTPSTVGNVEKAASALGVFEVVAGTVHRYKGTALRENLTNYFCKSKAEVSKIREPEFPKNSCKLEGIGSSAVFEWVPDASLPLHHYRIRKYNEDGIIDYDGVYVSEVFNPREPFHFVYDSHCAFCHVRQYGKDIKLHGVMSYQAFEMAQASSSA